MKQLKWMGPVAVAIGVIAFGLTTSAAVAQQAAAPVTEGITIDGEYGPFLPPDVSRDGWEIDRLIDVMHWFMILLFVGWGIFFVYCLVQFRHQPGRRAGYEMVKAKTSKYAEIGVAIFEAVLLLGFSIPVWGRVKENIPGPEQNPVKVRVVAEQFAWNFHYPGKDGVFGKTAPHLVNPATNPLGLDRSDPDAQDDFGSLELHLPINRSAICEITSKDVIHSFFIPVLRVKQDAIPGMRIPVWFHPVKTGTYEIACAQLCGNNHYSMRALLYLQEEDDFNDWMEEAGKPAEVFDEDEL